MVTFAWSDSKRLQAGNFSLKTFCSEGQVTVSNSFRFETTSIWSPLLEACPFRNLMTQSHHNVESGAYYHNSFNITEVITSETGVPRVKEEPVGLTVSLPERIPKQYVIPILARYYFRGGSHAQISFSAKNVDYSSTSLNGIPMRIVYIFHKYQFL